MSIIDLEAARKWKQVPQDLQKRIVDNVFCSKCKNTTIVDYDIHDNEFGVLLKGKCKKCGDDVTRLVEDI